MTQDAVEDHDENIVSQHINVGQRILVTFENKQFPGEMLSTSSTHSDVKGMEKTGRFYRWPRTDDILPYPFENITESDITRGQKLSIFCVTLLSFSCIHKYYFSDFFLVDIMLWYNKDSVT